MKTFVEKSAKSTSELPPTVARISIVKAKQAMGEISVVVEEILVVIIVLVCSM